MNEAAFKAVISGERRGLVPAVLRGGLSLLSVGYACGAGLNGLAYRWGLKRIHRLDVPVVSIGNVTAGGTGKTPFVAHVVRRLAEAGRRPAILSRGYRADDSGTNDERRVLDALCPGVPHVQNPDRVAAGRTAITDHEADILVLDDGFQHRRLGRDLDIVLIDARLPWGHGFLLPRGLLRERLAALRRADLVVVTRVDQCPPDQLVAIADRLRSILGRGPDALVAFPPRYLVDAEGRQRDLTELAGQPVLGFCGIGNPAAFRESLEQAELDVRGFRSFPDHHHFTAADLASIADEATRQDVAAVVCTEKDLVKILSTTAGDRPLWAVRIAVAIRDGADRLDGALTDVQTAAS